MKKTLILTLAAVSALLAASCQKEEGRVLTATIEQYEHNSKAYINDDHYACWEDGDAVNINGTPHSISLSTGVQANTATILGTENLSGNLMAYYPADGVTRMSSTGGTVTLPHIQTYAENTDGKQIINNPMAAYCPDGSTKLRFRNLCALLKVTIQVNAPTSVKAIQVKGIDNQMLCGEAQLKLSNQGLPMLSNFTNGSSSVTLKFETTEEITGSKSYYIVVPAASNFAQLTIGVFTIDGANCTYYSKTSQLGQSLSRNQIGAISYTPANDGDASIPANWMIHYTGTAQVTPSSTADYGCAYLTGSFSNNSGCLIFDGPVTKIGDAAFYECTQLTDITLPASLTSIENIAFVRCTQLTSITLPQGVTTISSQAFFGCSSLASITLPASLTEIGMGAFNECSSLTSITLPASLTSIGAYAFEDCSSLTSVDLPDGVTELTSCVFHNCTSLADIDLPDGLTKIGSSAFAGCTALSSIDLPESLTQIGGEAFAGCTQLTSIDLPESLTKIGSEAFAECAALSSIDLPESLTQIGDEAFLRCTQLTSIDLPESLTKIGHEAFAGCTQLTSINLPESLTKIGDETFAGCRSLTTVNVTRWQPSSSPSITNGGEDMFESCHSSLKIKVPAAALSTYQDAEYWSDYSRIIIAN